MTDKMILKKYIEIVGYYNGVETAGAWKPQLQKTNLLDFLGGNPCASSGSGVDSHYDPPFVLEGQCGGAMVKVDVHFRSSLPCR